jgi:RNA polymerase sigma factor (sigma-70 family)
VRVMSALFRAARPADFDRLYRDHAPSVYRYAFAVLGNHLDAEDVTQQTFLNAYRSIAQGTTPRKAENWLLTIAHNEVRRHLRASQGKRLEVELDEQLAPPAPERSEQTLADVLRALQHLPPTQREALVMREFEGRSCAEIAEIMNVTQSALEALIFRARRSLAEQLEGALTCAEAEQALSRRLDRRLPRREGRRLKAHLRECPSCVRFATVQKRQRSLLKGLSVMPVPASLFLLREQPAVAAAGLGGGVAGAGATGIAGGLMAKTAAVTAAAAVAGGVGYGVTQSPDAATKRERKATHAAAVAQTRRGGRAADVQATLALGDRPGPARPARARAHPKADKAKARAAKRATPAAKIKASEKAKPARAVAHAYGKAKRPVKATPAAKPELSPATTRARPPTGNRTGQTARELRKPRPSRPEPSARNP